MGRWRLRLLFLFSQVSVMCGATTCVRTYLDCCHHGLDGGVCVLQLFLGVLTAAGGCCTPTVQEHLLVWHIHTTSVQPLGVSKAAAAWCASAVQDYFFVC